MTNNANTIREKAEQIADLLGVNDLFENIVLNHLAYLNHINKKDADIHELTPKVCKMFSERDIKNLAVDDLLRRFKEQSELNALIVIGLMKDGHYLLQQALGERILQSMDRYLKEHEKQLKTTLAKFGVTFQDYSSQ